MDLIAKSCAGSGAFAPNELDARRRRVAGRQKNLAYQSAETLDRFAQKNPSITAARKAHARRGLALIQWLALGGECSVFIRVDEQGESRFPLRCRIKAPGAGTVLRQIVATNCRWTGKRLL
jgi:hypothetical protein